MAAREEIINAAFPKVVGGMVRLDEPIQTDWDFSTKFPQFLRNDLNLGDQENAFLRQLFSNDKLTDEAIKAIRDQLANCDLRLVTQVLKGLMSPADKTKLDGIATGANAYTHPNTGIGAGTYKSVTVNTQGHVTSGTNPTTLAGYGITDAAAKAHGNHVPTTQTANNSVFLRNDNTWQGVTPGNIGAYTKAEIDTKVTALNTSISGKENTFTKNNAFNKNFGNAAGTVCQGNDARLSDARKNPNALTISLNGTSQGGYDGSAAKAINITAANIGATAATMGGIVAGSLAQNGWVKFANGLILQWGFTTTTGIGDGERWGFSYVTFPVSFKNNPYMVSAIHAGSDPVIIGELLPEKTPARTTLLAQNHLGKGALGWFLFWFAIGV